MDRTLPEFIGLFFLTLLINPVIFYICAGVFQIFSENEDTKEGVSKIFIGLSIHLVLFIFTIVFGGGEGGGDDGRWDGGRL